MSPRDVPAAAYPLLVACFAIAVLSGCGTGAASAHGTPPLVEPIVFVDAAAQQGGVGSEEFPFRTIADALASGAERGLASFVVEVARGTYVEGPLVIDRPVTIRGGGIAPELSGSFEVTGPRFALRNVLLRDPGAVAVEVSSRVANVTLSDVEITDASGYGLRQHGGTLDLTRVTIAYTTLAGADRASGTAVSVAQGTRLTMDAVFLHHNVGGLRARGDGTHVTASGLLVEDSLENPIVQAYMNVLGCSVGYSNLGAVEFGDLATGTGENWTIRRSYAAGLYAHQGARVTVRGLMVFETRALLATDPAPECAWVGGFGAVAHVGGQLVLSEFFIGDSDLCGVVVGAGVGTAIDLTNGTIRTAPVGACVQEVSFDTSRLQNMVAYEDVGAPQQASSYTLPDAPDAL